MSFALTFGGFGDFVTLTQLILGTCQILINSFNATAECEDLIRYLSAFNNALETVRPLIRGEAHASLNGGFPPSAINALRDAVMRCKDEIEQFERMIVRLRDSDDRRLKARLLHHVYQRYAVRSGRASDTRVPRRVPEPEKE